MLIAIGDFAALQDIHTYLLQMNIYNQLFIIMYLKLQILSC